MRKGKEKSQYNLRVVGVFDCMQNIPVYFEKTKQNQIGFGGIKSSTELKLWVRAGFTSRQCASLKTCQLYNQTVISPFAYPSTILFFPPPPDLYFLFPSMPMDFSKGLWIRWQKKTIWLSTVTSCFSSWKMFYWSTAIFIDMTKKRITSVM